MVPTYHQSCSMLLCLLAKLCAFKLTVCNVSEPGRQDLLLSNEVTSVGWILYSFSYSLEQTTNFICRRCDPRSADVLILIVGKLSVF